MEAKVLSWSATSRRRWVLAVAVAAVASLFAPLASEAGAGTPPEPAAGSVLAENPGRGVVHRGLERARATGPCQNAFQLRHRDQGNRPLCTHGPDPSPAGVDVREAQSPEPPTSDELAASAAALVCAGTGTDGYRVQLVYARASDRADRYATLASSFPVWAQRLDDVINASAGETGGTRHVRFVHDASCQPVVSRVQLSPAGDDDFSNTIAELRAQGYNRSDRKYLVWMDANVYCGIAQVYNDDRASQDNYSNGNSQISGMVARVDNGCWGSATESIEAHELLHTLGAVQTTAANSTPNNHCSDEWDVMCYSDGSGVPMRQVCPSSHGNRLDCNHQDYFSTAPATGSYLATHWNTANSRFLTGSSTPPPTTTTTPPTTTTTPPPTTTTVPPVPRSTRFVDAVMVDLLGRGPTAAERSAWSEAIAGGYPRSSFTYALVTSSEYRNRVVNSTFSSILGRPLDPSNLAALVGLVAQGYPFETVTALVYASDEYFSAQGGTNPAYVSGLYRSVLGRSADAAGVNFWVGHLNQGMSRYTVAMAFLYTPERLSRTVSEAYVRFLGRPADTGGLNFWVAQLQGGLRQEVLFAAFAATDEYYQRV